MGRVAKKWLLAGSIALSLAAGAFYGLAPAGVEKRLNRVASRGGVPVSAKAEALHRRLFVADLHADSLLWGRDLLVRSGRGHVDVPRLIEAGVALQIFTVVTKTPRGLNIERNEDRSDTLTLLAIAQRWPTATWSSLRERALYQARRLRDMARRSEGRLDLILTAGDLEASLERRRKNPGMTLGFLGLEGAHALEGDVDNVDVLAQAGYRMIGLTHFFDNDLAGSAHGVSKGGLTEKGREVVRRLEARGILVDLAHASPRTIDDVLAMATRPVVVSHTGVKGTCDNVRNLSDAHLRGIARTGGVVGIGVWDTAVCGEDASAIARAIRHAVDVAGVDHVGLGSDFDGAVVAPFDVTGLPQVTEALLAIGSSEDEIAKVMGGNVLRLLRQSLPRE
jgi:microsomal dipeptidase-like Zn-dependent dipeptidase